MKTTLLLAICTACLSKLKHVEQLLCEKSKSRRPQPCCRLAKGQSKVVTLVCNLLRGLCDMALYCWICLFRWSHEISHFLCKPKQVPVFQNMIKPSQNILYCQNFKNSTSENVNHISVVCRNIHLFLSEDVTLFLFDFLHHVIILLLSHVKCYTLSHKTTLNIFQT